MSDYHRVLASSQVEEYWYQYSQSYNLNNESVKVCKGQEKIAKFQLELKNVIDKITSNPEILVSSGRSCSFLSDVWREVF